MSAGYVTVQDLGEHVGQTVSLKGWVRNFRSSGKISFLILRDGTGEVQCVFPKSEVSEETWARLDGVEYEASVEVTG